MIILMIDDDDDDDDDDEDEDEDEDNVVGIDIRLPSEGRNQHAPTSPPTSATSSPPSCWSILIYIYVPFWCIFILLTAVVRVLFVCFKKVSSVSHFTFSGTFYL